MNTPVRLGDIINLHYGMSLPKNRRVSGVNPVFGSGGCVGTHKTAAVKGPGIIVGRKGTIGSVHWSHKDFFPIDTTYYVEVKHPSMSMRFVFYLLKSLPLSKMNTDAAVPGLNRNNAYQIEINLPQEKHQTRITKTLSAYDNLIENNWRRIVLLEKSARSHYHEWFIKNANKSFRLDLMSKHKISDVWDIRYGKNLPKSKISETGKYPVHGAGGVIGHYGEKNVEQSLCLVSCRGHVGNVRRTFGPAFVTSNSFIFFPTKEFKNIPFFFTMFALEQINLAQARTGAAQPQLTLSNIKHFEVAIPSDQRLRQFSDICTPIYQQIDCLFSQNEKLAKARDLLLPRLIDGRIKP